MMDRIGNAIKEKRIAFGYTQERLAEIIGKTPSFIGQIERGVSKPSLETLEHLTHVLAIDANTYFYEKTDYNITNRELIMMIENLAPEKQEMTYAIIREIYRARS